MKRSYIKLRFLLIFTFFSISSFSQNPFIENSRWGTTELIDHEFEEIMIYQLDSTSYSRQSYFQVFFGPKKQFSAYNIPGCGLDCVIDVLGNIYTTNETIQFTISTITKRKGCSGETKMNKNIGTYYWIKEENSFRLVKSLKDEPKENYFESLNIRISDFEDVEMQKRLSKYHYLYNRTYQIAANKNYKKYTKMKKEASNWTYDAYSYANGKNTPMDTKFRVLAEELSGKLKQLYKQIEPKK